MTFPMQLGDSKAERLRQDLQVFGKALPEGVVQWDSRLEEDWSGDPSLFLYIVLTDEAARPDNLRSVSRDIQQKINELVHPLTRHGLNVYFSIRSQSEHIHLNDCFN